MVYKAVQNQAGFECRSANDVSTFANTTAGLLSAAGSDSVPAALSLPAHFIVDSLEKPLPLPQAPEEPSPPPLLAIVGPTAAGKSALALATAARWNGEIVNYDSVQLYRGFDIGAGKVPPSERRGVPHHLLDVAEPHQVFTAGDYRREALRVLESIRERRRLPILVGGTGLYLRALLLGLFEGPRRSESLRARLKAMAERHSRIDRGGRGSESGQNGGEFLHRLLRRLDPAAAARIHTRDQQKTLRAIEVCMLARQPMSGMLERGRSGLRGFNVIKIGLSPDRARLHERIDRRVEGMFAAGLLDEARQAIELTDGPRLKPLEALGYRQACAVLRGEITQEDAVRETQAATRQYAKRQMTWFRRETGVTWFGGFGDDPDIQRQIVQWLGPKLEKSEACRS